MCVIISHVYTGAFPFDGSTKAFGPSFVGNGHFLES